MIVRGLWCAILAASCLGCAPIRPTEVTVAEAGPGGSAAPASPPIAAPAVPQDVVPAGPDPAQELFVTRVLPILREKCSPCHFEGGRMYERLPFDQPGTIRVLGTDLFTRIRDEEERQAIRDFIGADAGAPEAAPSPP